MDKGLKEKIMFPGFGRTQCSAGMEDKWDRIFQFSLLLVGNCSQKRAKETGSFIGRGETG